MSAIKFRYKMNRTLAFPNDKMYHIPMRQVEFSAEELPGGGNSNPLIASSKQVRPVFDLDKIHEYELLSEVVPTFEDLAVEDPDLAKDLRDDARLRVRKARELNQVSREFFYAYAKAGVLEIVEDPQSNRPITGETRDEKRNAELLKGPKKKVSDIQA